MASVEGTLYKMIPSAQFLFFKSKSCTSHEPILKTTQNLVEFFYNNASIHFIRQYKSLFCIHQSSIWYFIKRIVKSEWEKMHPNIRKHYSMLTLHIHDGAAIWYTAFYHCQQCLFVLQTLSEINWPLQLIRANVFRYAVYDRPLYFTVKYFCKFPVCQVIKEVRLAKCHDY